MDKVLPLLSKYNWLTVIWGQSGKQKGHNVKPWQNCVQNVQSTADILDSNFLLIHYLFFHIFYPNKLLYHKFIITCIWDHIQYSAINMHLYFVLTFQTVTDLCFSSFSPCYKHYCRSYRVNFIIHQTKTYKTYTV